MAIVSDSSLLSAAHEIVNNFMDNDTTLNTGVQKKASELGLNTDQTMRLIEKTNTEAFLRKYPSTTEFDVASPEVVCGIKTSSVKRNLEDCKDTDEGLFKAASAKDGVVKNAADYEYVNAIDRTSLDDIFGLEAGTKVASSYEPVSSPENKKVLEGIWEMTKTSSELAQKREMQNLEIEKHAQNMFAFVKEAALQGKPIGKMEEDLIASYPDEESNVRALFDNYEVKLASEMTSTAALTRANDVKPRYVVESPITKEFGMLLQSAGEE